MESGRSVGELLLIIKAAGGTIESPTIAILFILCISMRRSAWDGQGPNLFESAPKFPRKVKKTGIIATLQQCSPKGRGFHGAAGGRGGN